MNKAIKLGIIGVLVLLGLASVLTVKHLRAAESVRTIDDHDPRGYVAKFKYTLVPNKTEAVADGSDTISFTFGAFYITPFPAGCTDEACNGKDVVYYPCSQGASEANPKPLCMVHEYNNGCDTPNLNDPPLSAVSIDMTDDFSAAAGLNQVVPDQFIKNDVTVIPVSSFSCQNGLATFQIKSTTP